MKLLFTYFGYYWDGQLNLQLEVMILESNRFRLGLMCGSAICPISTPGYPVLKGQLDVPLGLAVLFVTNHVIPIAFY